MISFGINVPITQTGSIIIDSDNFADYLITNEWTGAGRTVVDGVNYYDNKTFSELLATFTDDENEVVSLNFMSGGRGFPEDSSDWLQSEIDGKTVSQIGINVKSYTTWVDNLYRYSIEMDVELYYEETIDTDGDGVLDYADVFPNDATETVDTDEDGVGDNSDAFPNDATETTDTDGDGVGDNTDIFPNDVTESTDKDNDGIGDNADDYDNTELFSSGAINESGAIELGIKPSSISTEKAVYTYTSGGGSGSPDANFVLALGAWESSDMISFGINVPITQTGSIIIDSDNFADYLITNEWTGAGRTVVDGVNYYDNKTFSELLATFTDDENEVVSLNFMSGGRGFPEDSSDWLQSEIDGKTVSQIGINVKSYTTWVDNLYRYSIEMDVELYYEEILDTDAPILEVGGNTDGTKGFISLNTYQWAGSDWNHLQESDLQTDIDYRGTEYNLNAANLADWDGEKCFEACTPLY